MIDTLKQPTSRRTALIGGTLILASAAGASVKLYEREEPPINRPIAAGIPKRFGGWMATETDGLVRPEESPTDKSIYDQEVSRIYRSADVPEVMLLIAYGSTQSDTLQVHRPEFCYPAAGFQIGESEPLQVDLGLSQKVPSAFFTAARGERTEQVLYWTRLGGEFPTSWVGQHVARAKNSLRGLVPDGVLVRASLIDADAVAGRQQLSSFLNQLVNASSPLTRRALIGSNFR
jgi:EpsI family protein